MILGRSSMKDSETSLVTTSPGNRRTFPAAPVLTAPWMVIAGRPARSSPIHAA